MSARLNAGELFSPPYGDGTSYADECDIKNMFSPPYGDGTYEGVDFWQNIKFSPPCGDRTEIAAYKALTA